MVNAIMKHVGADPSSVTMQDVADPGELHDHRHWT